MKKTTTKTAKSSSRKTSTKSTKSSKKSTTSISAIGTLTRATDRTKLKSDTWVVFRGPSGERKPMLFDSSLTRDTVRGTYSKITGVSKERTRSRRLINY